MSDSNGAFLGRDAILGLAANREPHKVTIPKLGTIYLRPLTMGEVEGLQKDPDVFTQLASVLSDDQGKLLFDAKDPQDLAALRNAIPLLHIQPILDAAITLNRPNVAETIKN